MTFSHQPTLTCMILETIITPQAWHFQSVVCRFQYYRIDRDFVQISILLNKTNLNRNLNEIYHISVNIESTKKADHIWKRQDFGYFLFIICRILLLKLSLRKIASNYFKDERRHSIHLDIVMFHGIPCNILCWMWLAL